MGVAHELALFLLLLLLLRLRHPAGGGARPGALALVGFQSGGFVVVCVFTAYDKAQICCGTFFRRMSL